MEGIGENERLSGMFRVFLTITAAALSVWVSAPSGPGLLAQTTPAIKPGRIVVIKVDGLPADLLAAVSFPERADLMARLDYAADLQKAIAHYRRQTGRQVVLPNIRRYFFEDGVVFDNMFSHTLTLSAVAWSIIETGQPSVVKGHGTFSRDTGYTRSHLDGLRDTINYLMVRPGYGQGRNSATWVLDQVGIPLMSDAFDPFRTWTAPQVYGRLSNRELLLEGGRHWLKGGANEDESILRSHLSRMVTGIDYTEFNQEISGMMTERKILEKDLAGSERFDYISPLFTLMDHQQHVDPHPINLIHWLVKLDNEVGAIFHAVSQSQRRDRTLVAMISDHGSEIQPGVVGFSFPITRVFRDRLHGGHTVKTMLVEQAWKAVSVPIPGLDRPRIYESAHSPYNKRGNPKHGEDGYVTAFIDPFGNARAAVHLRNNDLNRLHLLLLELKDRPQGERRNRLKSLFRQTLAETRRWLVPDVALYRDYHEGAKDLAAQMRKRFDRASLDTVHRLESEAELDARQLASLERLLSITFGERDSQGMTFENAFGRDFRISDYIPKEFLGRANEVRQLRNYTIGIDPELNWVSETVDHQGRPRPMDYIQLLCDYKSANAPRPDLENPYDIIVTRLALDEARQALLALKLVEPRDRLRNVVWVKSTSSDRPHKGGEALIAGTEDDRIQYLPIRKLRQAEDRSYSFTPTDEIDPLALLRGPGFAPGIGVEPAAWMRRLRPAREWLKAGHRTEYGVGVNIILDLVNDAVPEFVDSPQFQRHLLHFSSSLLKERYLRGLKRKYEVRAPDFIAWAEELWNFNSKARTSGGNHSGLRPIVSKLACMIWGGDETGVARGRTIRDVHTSLDFVPTLFRALGMLDDNGRVVKAPNSVPERTFSVMPGRVVDIWRSRPPVVLDFSDEN